MKDEVFCSKNSHSHFKRSVFTLGEEFIRLEQTFLT